MYSRQEYERLRSAENLEFHRLPMPAIREQSSQGGLYHAGDYRSSENLRGRAGNLEAHEHDYSRGPYRNISQGMPLLLNSFSREQLYDPAKEHPPCLPSRVIHESSGSAPAARSLPGSFMGARPVKIRETMRLFGGNLVLDCPVPIQLGTARDTNPHQRDEFTHMRYTAATCDPSDFLAQGFTLRQPIFAQRRSTELLIVVTMYNENDFLFARTMAGVFQNIQYMCCGKGKHGGTWGKDGWKKIVVCVVSDGRSKLNPRTAAVVTALGVYQKEMAHQRVGQKDVTAHIYEYTTRVGIETNNRIVKTRPGMDVPVQMIFCLKEKNQKKINSHRWALQAFGAVLRPNICVLLDAGTRPGPDSIYHLWHAFHLDEHCAGACGEIKAFLGKNKRKLINPLVATQNFEYKMSNILDKPMESAFGFISVLPGAFSAYRYIALQNGPLEKYFAGESMRDDSGVFANNMYLAEDRILCFELVAKRDARWVLAYVQSATGETDVPEEMPELINQRRRWLNGSFFASIYALTHFYQIFNSSHSKTRKAFFMIEFTYQLVNMVFSWFAVANFFLVFQILTTSLAGLDLLGNTGQVLSVVIEWLYLGSLATCFVLSLGNTPDGSKSFYMTVVVIWGLIMVYLSFAAIFITVKSVQTELADQKFTFVKMFSNSVFFTLIVSLLSTYILWIFISIVFLDPWHIATSSLQYLLLSPTYTNVINVFAFCNTHDISWGTRGVEDNPEAASAANIKGDGNIDIDVPLDSDLNSHYDFELQKFSTEAVESKPAPDPREEKKNYYKSIRSYVVLFWMFSNAALIAVVLKVGGLNRLDVQQPTDQGKPTANVAVYLQVILWSVAAMSAFKFVGAMWYQIIRVVSSLLQRLDRLGTNPG